MQRSGVRPKGRAVILLIEDHADTREMYAQYLHHAGYAVIDASDAERAVRVVEAVTPDLVITDMKLPFIDGFALLRFLRDDRPSANVPIIAMSGEPDITAHKARQAGCTVFISKPYPS
jgi:CheY-like chemotaxis protein